MVASGGRNGLLGGSSRAGVSGSGCEAKAMAGGESDRGRDCKGRIRVSGVRSPSLLFARVFLVFCSCAFFCLISKVKKKIVKSLD